MRSVNVAVLDVDGTVATCPYDFEAMRAAVARAGARYGVDTRAPGVEGIIEQIERAAAALGNRGARFREEADAAVTAIEVEAAGSSVLVPGAAEALSRLRREGVAVALITRNCRRATALVLSGLEEYDLLLTRDDVPRAKPDPDHVLRCLARLSRDPTRGVLVGDHRYDIQAGRAAGMRYCVGVRTGTGSAESLLEAGADRVLDSVADLPGWLLEGRGDQAP